MQKGIPVDFDPFANGIIEGKVAATEAQKEIWASVKFGDKANCAFNESLNLELKGPLDTTALHFALQDVVDTHDALRSTFTPDGRFFSLNASVPINLRHSDLSQHDKTTQVTSTKEIEREAATQPFDLVHGSLFRLHLMKCSDENHQLLVTAHHIIMDGWSFWVFLEELAARYNARKNNIAPVITPAYQFSQYARDLAEQQQTQKNRADLDYWLQQFSPVPEPLAFPTDNQRPQFRTFDSNRVDYPIEEQLVKALRKQSGLLGVTFMGLLHSALSCYISRICRTKDVVIGVPAAGQASSGNYQLIGHCINLLPLRCRIDENNTFAECAQNSQKTLLDGYEHQQITYGTLVQHLKLSRDSGSPPVVSIIFNIDQDMDAVDFDELEVGVSSPPRAFENFDLFLNIVQIKKGLTIECQYDSLLFQQESIQRHLDGLVELLTAISTDANQRIKNLPLVSAQERKLLLDEYNTTSFPLPPYTSFTELFRCIAKDNKDKTAVIFKNASLSYADLDLKSDQLAAHIQLSGIQPGELVGIYLNRSINMLVSTLAVIKAGAGYVPLDPDYPTDRLQYMIDDSGIKLLISESSLSIDFFTNTPPSLNIDEEWDNIAGCDITQIKKTSPAKDSICYVIYTSGSTGKPKGVAVPNRCVLNFLLSMQQTPGITQSDSLLAVTTLSFDIAVLELYLPIISSATVTIASKEEAMDGKSLRTFIEEKGVTILQATPSTWQLLLSSEWEGSPHLKALCGGEALPQHLVNELVPKVKEMWNMYGPTETTVWSTTYKIAEKNTKILIGKPIGNTSILILDPNKQLVPRGVAGELYIGGKGVTAGYLHREELTRKAFVKNPFSSEDNDIIYRTGDLVKYRQDGNIEYITRLDNQVKLRGFRIELGEIETAISSFAGIRQVVVNIFVHSASDQRLVAYLIADEKIVIDVDTLKSSLRQSLPNYMIPQHFVFLNTFPLTANGKIDRKSLPAPFTDASISKEREEPRNDFERSMLAVWQEVLGVDNIGINDDFFDSGGHSLLALELVNKLKKATGITFEYASIFSAPTIKQLVAAIDSKAPVEASSIVTLQSKGSDTPLFCLCGINLYKDFAQSLGENQPVYAIYANEEQALLEKAIKGEVAKVSVHKLAKTYYQAIKRQQPTGPYNLAGISFGGVLAIEVAKLIKEKGDNVSLVILLDTVLRKGIIGTNRIRYFGHVLQQEGIQYITSKIKKVIGKRKHPAEESDEAASIQFRELAYLQAMEEYENSMPYYDGDVVLVRALENFNIQTSSLTYMEDYGWGEHLTGNFTTINIPGSHLEIIQPPCVTILSEKLVPFLKTGKK